MKYLALVSFLWSVGICAEVQDIAMNIKRLHKHFYLLNQFNKKNKKEHLIDWETQAAVPFFLDLDVNCSSYKHPLVVLCLKKMNMLRSLDPLFETWDIFLKEYKQVEGSLFLHEISILTFCLYKNILCTLDAQRGQRVNAVEIINLYNKINGLPIDEVLTALDHCYVRLIFVLKEYEFFSTMSWGEWLAKYWWLPPMVAIGFLWKIVLYKFMSHLVTPDFSQQVPALGFESSLLG